MTKEEFIFELCKFCDYPEYWLDRPNSVFNNQLPREMMETPEGLIKLQEMLEFLKKTEF